MAPSIGAQSAPNDPQCPITGNTVTCTGAIPDGFIIFEDQVDTFSFITDFNFNNLTAPIIADANGIGIGNSGTEDVTINIDDTADITLIDNPTDIITGASGIITILEDANVNLTSAATIDASTTGTASFGIFVESDTGNQTINNSGNISVTSTGTGPTVGVGIAAIGAGIGTTGFVASGAQIINNSGDLSLDTGNGLTDGVAGAVIGNNIGNNVSVDFTNSGNVQASGNLTNGIFLGAAEIGSGMSEIELQNSGAISVDGSNLAGINIQNLAGASTQNIINSGDITVNNASSAGGILFITVGSSDDATIENSGDIIINETVGTGFGVATSLTNLSGTGGDSLVAVLNSGNIIGNTGSIIFGINAQSALDDTVTVTLENTGTIDLINSDPGFISIGILAEGDNAVGAGGEDDGVSTFVLNNTGAILTAGAAGALNAIGDSVTVTNSGTITSSTVGNSLIILRGLDTDSVINFTNSGDITADNNALDIINIGDTGTANITLTDGTFTQAETGGGGAAIRSLGAAVNLILEESVDVNGDIVLGAGNDVVTTTSNNEISGDILLGDGNDTITLVGASSGIINLGGGDDTISIIGNAGASGVIGGLGNDTLNIQIAENDELELDFSLLDGFITGIETFNQNGLGTGIFLGEDQDFVVDYNLNGGVLLGFADLPQANITTLAGTRLIAGGGILDIPDPDPTVQPITADGIIGNLTVNGVFTPTDIAAETLIATSVTVDTVINSIGTLTTNNLTLSPTALFEVDVNDAGESDLVIVNGTDCLLYTSPSPRD